MECSELEEEENGGMNGNAQYASVSAAGQHQNGGLCAAEQIRCGEWINIGGAIDMKVRIFVFTIIISHVKRLVLL